MANESGPILDIYIPDDTDITAEHINSALTPEFITALNDALSNNNKQTVIVTRKKEGS